MMFDVPAELLLTHPAFVQANPPETVQTDISLSQFLAIQEKGVSAWEFEPELEIANCFVEARTEIEFFDSECSVQSNLPVPKQNEVYYWEAKIYDKPESTTISIGMTTKPYPLFRLPGKHLLAQFRSRMVTNLNVQVTTKAQSHIYRAVKGDLINHLLRHHMDRNMCREMLLVSDIDHELEVFSSLGMEKSWTKLCIISSLRISFQLSAPTVLVLCMSISVRWASFSLKQMLRNGASHQ